MNWLPRFNTSALKLIAGATLFASATALAQLTTEPAPGGSSDATQPTTQAATQPMTADNTPAVDTASVVTQGNPVAADTMYEQVRQSLVAVKYQWQEELGQHEIVGAGVVVREDGLVMVPLVMVSDFIPESQMKDFKIIIPSDTGDETEIDATFVGRDERSNSGFVQATGKHDWKALHFAAEDLKVGQALYSVGLLPKAAGYKAYLTQATVAANLRGEIPQVLISGALGNIGAPVLDISGNAIGIVHPQEGQEPLLDNRNELSALLAPPHFFERASFFLTALEHPPAAGEQERIPWTGITQMTGVNQQLAEFLGLKNQPAAQVGDVVADSPAAKAGLAPGNVIVKMNGQPLERGDLPEEIPQILRRRLIRMHVGDKVTLTVLPDKGQPLHDITVTLEQRPKQPSQAQRFYAQDLGFVAREAVFVDLYTHKMKPDGNGVVVANLRRDGAAATAKLGQEDFILQLNGQSVANLRDFKQDYEAFRKDHPREPVVLVVHRPAGREETINIEPPQGDAQSPMPAPGEGQ